MDPKLAVKRLLTGIESYNPEHRATLEKHVLWQIANCEYDFEANLALLRLYQFHPNLFNAEFAKLVLLKSICSLNPADFTLCKYLINLDRLREEPIATVVELGTLLDTCQFPEFWVKENPELSAAIPGFKESVHRFIGQAVSQIYQRVHKSLLASLFDVSENELKSIIKQNSWTEIAGDNTQVLVNNHEQNVKSVKIRERVNFDAITSMSSAFRPSKSDFFIKTGS